MKTYLSLLMCLLIIQVNLAYGDEHQDTVRAKAYQKQAEMYLELGDHKAALGSIEAGIQSILPKTESKDNESDIPPVLDEKQYLNLISLRGKIFRKKSQQSSQPETDLKSALDQYLLAARAIDHIRRGLLTEGSRLFLQKTTIPIYEDAIKTCYELYFLTKDEVFMSQAFFFMEKSKASVLSEALQAANMSKIRDVPDRVLQKEKEINRYIHSLELKISNGENEVNDSLSKATTRELFHAKISLDSLTQAIRKKYPNYHQLKYEVDVITLPEVQSELADDAMLITYFEGNSSWFSMSVTKEKVHFERVKKTDRIQKGLKDLRNNLSNSSSDLYQLTHLSFDIYQIFLKPHLLGDLQPERIIVIPDGILGYIPFDALVDERFSEKEDRVDPHYLIEKYTFSYANSMTLYLQKTDIEKDTKYVGFAPTYPSSMQASTSQDNYRGNLAQLSGNQEEVKQAGKLFDGEVFLENEATEYNFKNLKASPAILHLAMHALVNDRDPMRSKLIFSSESDSVEDGSLNVYEIYGLQIGSQLAVLSACNSGFGEINKGEGIMSLSRAFRYAGCPNIVMSLWRAKDQPTREIMTDFFKYLKNEQPKDKALRMAKLDYLMKAGPLKAHPANWATFVLLGNSDPVKFEGKFKKYWVLSLAVFFVVTAFIYYRRNKRKKAN